MTAIEYAEMMRNQVPEIVEYLEENTEYTLSQATWGEYVIVNSVKIEWNYELRGIVIGFKNSDEDKRKLRELIENSFDEPNIKKTTGSVRFLSKAAKPEDFYKVIRLMEELEFELEAPNTENMGKRKFEKNKSGYAWKMATIIKTHFDTQFGNLDRNTLGMDEVDEFIMIGESVNYSEDNSWREHIVPCDFIWRESMVMFEENSSVTEVAEFIHTHLKIILVSKEEANMLDGELGLRDSMPEGWKVGDSVFARLKAANIKLK